MKLDDINTEWEEDCRLNVDLTKSSMETPKLLAKYLKIISDERQRQTMYEQAQLTLLKKKFLYYKDGGMTKEEIEAEGWEFDPFKGKTILTKELDYYYNADTDIQKSVVKIAIQKNKILLLKEIIDVLKWRHLTIKNILDNRKFEAGSNGQL